MKTPRATMKDKIIKTIAKYSEPLGDAYHRKISPSAIKEVADNIVKLYADKSESDVNADIPDLLKQYKATAHGTMAEAVIEGEIYQMFLSKPIEEKPEVSEKVKTFELFTEDYSVIVQSTSMWKAVGDYNKSGGDEDKPQIIGIWDVAFPDHSQPSAEGISDGRIRELFIRFSNHENSDGDYFLNEGDFKAALTELGITK